MGKKISDLSHVEEVLGSDLIEIERGGVSYKGTPQQIATLLNEGANAAENISVDDPDGLFEGAATVQEALQKLGERPVGTDSDLRPDLASTDAGKGVELVANAVRSSAASDPINTGKLWFSDTGWHPEDDPVYGRSTPQTATFALGGHYDEIGGALVNYKWGISAYFTNPNTMPITCIDAVAAGWKVRALGGTARQFGNYGDAHACELIIGQYASRATVTTVNGSDVLTVTGVTLEGSKFCRGNPISGTNIPVGATITSITKDGVELTGSTLDVATEVSGGTGYVVGDILTVSGGTRTIPAQLEVRSVSSGAITSVYIREPGNYTAAPSNPASVTGGSGSGATFNLEFITAGYGYPDTIKISAPATGSGSSSIEVLSLDTQGIALLITGSGDGGEDGKGNPNGRGIQFQSYGDAALYRGIVFGSSALRTDDGIGIQFTSAPADRGIQFESCTMTDALRVTGGSYSHAMEFTGSTYSAPMINISGNTGTIGINFATNTWSSVAMAMGNGNDISFGTSTGGKIGTSSAQKIGFWGATPVTRPAVTGSKGGNAALTSLIAAVASAGLITDNTT